MSRKKKGSIVIENGQERDLADSRDLGRESERAERGRELRKLAKDSL